MSTLSPPGPKLRKVVNLTPAQRRYLDSPAVFRAFVGGRGAGKSFVGAYDLLKRMRARRTYLVAAPTYQMLRDATLTTFRKLCEDLAVTWTLLKADMTARMGNGAEILFRSADNPDRLRGPNLSGAWLDEASVMGVEPYQIVMGALRECGEQGWLSTTFTPRGLGHWTYELFGGDAKADTELVRSRTADNPFNPPDFAATIERQYSPTLALQELGGEFVSLEGAEWPPEYFDHAAFWFDYWPDRLAVKTVFLDPSKGNHDKAGDYAAEVRYGRAGDGTEYAEADLRRLDADAIVARGVETVKTFAPDGYGIEENAFQHLFAPLFRSTAAKARVEVPLYLVNNTTPKVVRIRRLTEPLQRRCMRFRNTPGTRLLVQQLREFPLGEHDDGPDALEGARRLAIKLANAKTPIRQGVRR